MFPGDEKQENVGLQTCSYESLGGSASDDSLRIPDDRTVTGMIKNLKGYRVILMVSKEKVS